MFPTPPSLTKVPIREGLENGPPPGRRFHKGTVWISEEEECMQPSENITQKRDRRREERAHPPRPADRKTKESAVPPECSAFHVLLRNMKHRQKGMISKVDANGELGRSIRDMGIVPGAPIELQGRAPLNDPVAVNIRGCTLALRNNEADQIWVGMEEGVFDE